MYRRDLLTAEIQKLAQALARIVGLKEVGSLDLALDELNEILVSDFGILLVDLIKSDQENFSLYLIEQSFSPEKLDMFSQILYTNFSFVEVSEDNCSLGQKLLLIYQLLESKHHVINMINIDRQKKITSFLAK